MIPVYWMTRYPDVAAHGPWDTRILDRLFAGELWPHRWEFEHHYNVDRVETAEHAIIVLPARHHTREMDLQWLNDELRSLTHVLIILAGDEEGSFPWRHIVHPNCRFWIQHPNTVIHKDTADWAFFYGCGSPIDFGGDALPPHKDVDWAFAGQNSHPGRRRALMGLGMSRTPGAIHPSSSFTGGLPQDQYRNLMLATKVAPAPSGPHTVDTFRFYEALEAGCWPLVDAASPVGKPGYWQMVYGVDFPSGGVREFPFDVITDWDTAGGVIEARLAEWPRPSTVALAWWKDQCRRMVERLNWDLREMKAEERSERWNDLVTVVMTTSPIPSNPDTFMIEESLDSVERSMGTKVPTIIVADGVRPQQEEMGGRYDEYVNRLCWQSMNYARHRLTVPKLEHLHQIRATQVALQYVQTPVLLFMEHDTPLTNDPIDWEAAVGAVAYGALDVLRFHHESQILDVHKHLMLDDAPTDVYGLPVQRTRQWSQRPHLARYSYYTSMLAGLQSRPNNGFIEDAQYSQVSRNPRDHRVAIYSPEGTLCRSYHLDGRAGGPKFDDVILR